MYSYSVRTVSTLDIIQKTWDDLRECYVLTFVNAYKDVSPDIFKPQSLEEFCINVFDADKKSIEDQDFKCIILEEDTVLIAYVLIHECQPENKVHILHLAVNPHIQSKGLGKLLLNLAAQAYPQASHVCLSTRDFRLC